MASCEGDEDVDTQHLGDMHRAYMRSRFHGTFRSFGATDRDGKVNAQSTNYDVLVLFVPRGLVGRRIANVWAGARCHLCVVGLSCRRRSPRLDPHFAGSHRPCQEEEARKCCFHRSISFRCISIYCIALHLCISVMIDCFGN